LVSSKDSQRSRFTIPAEYDDFDLLEYNIESGHNDDPEKILELRDMKDKIREIIETKYEDGNDKKTLLLKYFSSETVLPNKEVAQKIGIGERQVSRYVRRASKKIKNILKYEEKKSELFR
jgi:DNA-directed RNA polymerase specialized sigma subunit